MEITILHLSDLQFGRHHVNNLRSPLYKDGDYESELEKLLDDLKILAEKGVKPNFIVVTGDIAEWSKEEEYIQAEKFLLGICSYLQLDRRYLVMVPGNHDVNRKLCTAARLIAEETNVSFDPPYYKKFAHYESFFNNFYNGVKGLQGRFPYQFREDRLFVNYYFPEHGVAFVGLNSCVDESDQEPHYGNITVEQLRKAAGELNEFDSRKELLRIAVLHHNFQRASDHDEENLRDADELLPLFREAPFHLILHGHRHVSQKNIAGGGNRVIDVLATGSTGLDRAKLPANCRRYQVIKITDNQVQLYKRYFDETKVYLSGQGCWCPDLDPGQGSLNETFQLKSNPDVDETTANLLEQGCWCPDLEPGQGTLNETFQLKSNPALPHNAKGALLQNNLVKTVEMRAPLELARRQDNIKRTAKMHNYRSEFMRDRDRILFSDAFRKLAGKTQIFQAQFEGLTRTRYSHTIEVSQLSRTVSTALHLDNDLVEAIAFGHDIGHTPFGHVGERALNVIMNECDNLFGPVGNRETNILEPAQKGFKHNFQSLRVAVDLEQPFKKIPGLNLTNFTLWGMLNHSSLCWKCKHKLKSSQSETGVLDKNFDICLLNPCPTKCKKELGLGFYDGYLKDIEFDYGGNCWSFEGFIVKICDEIAQRHHDIQDGLQSGILTPDMVLDGLNNYFSKFIYSRDIDEYNYLLAVNAAKQTDFKREVSSFIVPFYLNQLITNSTLKLTEFLTKKQIADNAGWKKQYMQIDDEEVKSLIGFSEEFQQADIAFQKNFLKDSILNSFQVQRMDGHGTYIIRKLFKAYLMNPELLPDEVIYQMYKVYDAEAIDKEWNRFNLSRPIGSNSASDKDKIISMVGTLRNGLNHDRHKVDFRTKLFRTICDYIASMTDEGANREYKGIYG